MARGRCYQRQEWSYYSVGKALAVYLYLDIHYHFSTIMNRLKIIFSTLVLSAVLVGFASESFAQEFQQPYKHIEVGFFATGGLSIFQGNVPDGAKTDIQSAYTFGALGSFMIDPQFGFALGMGYEKRGAYFHKESKTEPNETYTLNYISIQPSVRFKSFLLGVNIGMPVGGTDKYTPGSSGGTDISFERDFKDSMATNIDIRASALLPIVENDNGNLYFMIQAAYSISDALGKNGFRLSPFIQTDPLLVNKGSPIPTIQIGLSYLLSPGGKK